MPFLSRFRRRKSPYAALTDEERISRYVYLLNTLPASVIESAHARAFAELPSERRREMFEQLKPFMSEAEQTAASDDPTVLARLVRRAEERRAERAANGGAATTSTATDTRASATWEAVDARDVMAQAGVTLWVATHFLSSGTIGTYYTAGAGSLLIGGEPGWVGQTFDPSQSGPGALGADYGGGYGGMSDGAGFGGVGFDGGGGGGDGGGGG